MKRRRSTARERAQLLPRLQAAQADWAHGAQLMQALESGASLNTPRASAARSAKTPFATPGTISTA